MATFYEVVQNYLVPYYWYIVLFASIILFGFLSKYAYDKYYAANYEDGNKDFTDVANANMREKELSVYFFYVDWCPHCKKALPEWQAFSDVYNGKQINGYQIECKDLDCTNDKDPNIKLVIDKYSLKQFPTVIAVLPGPDGKEMRVDYEAKVKKDYLEKFANSVALENSGM